jgi:hypothetical protein
MRATSPAFCASAATGAARRPPANVPRNVRREITRSPGCRLVPGAHDSFRKPSSALLNANECTMGALCRPLGITMSWDPGI